MNKIGLKEREIMPLVFAPIGKDLRIVKILTDYKTKKHLESWVLPSIRQSASYPKAVEASSALSKTGVLLWTKKWQQKFW